MNSVTNSHAVKFTPQVGQPEKIIFPVTFSKYIFQGYSGSQWVSGTGLVYGFWPTASSSAGLTRGRFQTDGRTDVRTIGRWPRGRP
jgi:hypothetical protein